MRPGVAGPIEIELVGKPVLGIAAELEPGFAGMLGSVVQTELAGQLAIVGLLGLAEKPGFLKLQFAGFGQMQPRSLAFLATVE